MRKLRKLFTISVVVFTITWAVGLAAFVPTAQAVSLSSGDLIKASLAAVYYYGADGARYVFPNEKTYMTWYSDFSSVITITDSELAAIPIGGNVTYRPGVKMLKINTDPKVYAVEQNGTLRWVKTEAVASCLYGSEWGTMIDDVSDAFFVNYTVGSPIEDCADYAKTDAMNASPSINVDKGLAADDGTTPGTGGALSIALASDSPAGQSVPGGATPASNVLFTKINLTAGSDAVVVDKVRITRTGLSADADLTAIRLWSGATQLDTAQTLNSSHQATFNVNKTIAANSTLVLTISGDLLANVGLASSEIKLGIASNTDVVSNASSVTGAPVWGNTMTAVNTAVGSLTIQKGGSMPAVGSSVDLNQTETFFGVKFTAGSTEDVQIRSFTFKSGNNSSINVGDLEEITVINDTTGDTIATMSSTAENGDVVVDLSSSPLVLAKGATRDIILRAKVVDGAGRNVAFDIHDGVSFLVDAVGSLYGFGVALNDGGGWNTLAGTTGVGPAVAVNEGTVTISKADTCPAAGNIAVGGTEINVAEFSYDLQGEDVRFGTTVVTLNVVSAVAGNCTAIIDNIKLVDDQGDALAGPVSPTGTIAGGVCTATFSSSYELPNGENTVSVLLNTTSAIVAGNTVQAVINTGNFANVRGLTSNKVITPAPTGTPITANTQTVQGAYLAAEMGATPIAGNVVAGKSGMWIAYVGLDASAGGEDVRVQNMTLALTGTLANTDWINAKLIDVATGMQVGQTVQPSATNTINFTFSGDELLVAQAQQKTLALEVDILSTATGGTAQFDVTVLAGTGKFSATAAATNTIPTGVLSPLQTVIVSGTLTASLDPDTATPAQLVSSSTGNSVVTYNLEAVDEDIDVTDIYLVITNAAGTAVPAGIAANLLSLEVYADGVKLGSSLSASSTGTHLLALASPLTIGKDDKTVVTIKANMQTKANISSGTIFRIGVASLATMAAQSTVDATEMTVAGDISLPNYTVTIATGGGDGSGVVVTASTATGITLTCDTTAPALNDPTWAQVAAAINADPVAAPLVTATNGIGSTNQVVAGDAQTLVFANAWGGAGSYNIVATGVDSGAVIGNINTTGLVGGLIAGGSSMSAHDGVLTVTLNSSSPSGLKVSATNQELMRINLTATGDDITIGAIDMNATLNVFTPGWAALSAVKSADGSVTYYNSAATLAAANVFVPAGIVNTLSVSKDTTKVIKIESDTTGATNPDTIQAALGVGANTTNGIAWFAKDKRCIGHTAAGLALIAAWDTAVVDGDGSGAWTGPATKELPLTGGAISY